MPNITTTQIPFSAPDLIRPGAGAEQWHNGSARISNPTSSQPQGTENSLDVYYRFSWSQVETGNGVYNWNYFDNLVKGAINKGQKLSFGIMTHRGEDDADGRVSYGGGVGYYPAYLHNLMQSESSNSRDFLVSGIWVPNFNSPNYISRLRALHEAIKNRLLTQTYTASSGPNAGKQVLFADAIYCIDVRGFGTWGEWHSCCGMADFRSGGSQGVFPSGRVPTIASLKAIIDTHTQVFDRWPLVMMVAAYDAGISQFPIFHPYPEVAHYALTARNAWGPVGWRRDQWGATDSYLNRLLKDNTITFNGSPQFKNLIMERWKTSPITGEPMPGQAPADNMVDIVNQVKLYHATSFGNGNWPLPTQVTTTAAERIREAFKTAGYRLAITGGSYTNTNNSLSITLNWQNSGIAPTYEDWNVEIFLKTSSGVKVTGGISSFKPKLFPPSSTSVSDIIPISAPAGNYTLAARVVDPKNYRQPMPLFIENRQSDGSYHLGTVTIGGVTLPNNPPTVIATGATVTLPVNSASISATALDSDGTIVSYNWSKVSGPTGGAIVSPSTASTTVANLSQGTYVFQVTVTDNQGATATATATVVANALANVLPMVNAGGDKDITLPVNSVTLDGSASDSDGTVTVMWTRLSGSGNITSPTSRLTTVTGLTQGTSIFRLTATDDDGASVSDTVSVIVRPAIVVPTKTIVGITATSTETTYTVTYSDGSKETFKS